MRQALALIGISALLVGCPGGGDGGGGGSETAMTQVGGVVVAPNGQMAKAGPPTLFRWFVSLFGLPEEAVALPQGLSPVPNARVFLINVDNTGRPIGGPLAMGTTDTNGAFVFSVSSAMNLSPTASTLTIIQAAAGSAPGPVPVGSPGVLNIPAVQQLMLVDPAGELGTRRIVAAGLSNFSTAAGTAAAAGYVGLIQAFLDQAPSLVGVNISTTITNIQNDITFQNEILPALVDIEQSAHVDQSLFTGTYNLFEYHTYADTPTTPFHRTTEHGDLTFDPKNGTVLVNSNEFGGTLQETCSTICTRTFTLQSFIDQSFGDEGLFFRTATNRLIFSAPGSFSFSAHANPTGTVAIFGVGSADGERSIGIAVKNGSSISGADLAAPFNYVDFGSVLNIANVNQPSISGSSWTGILQSRSGTGSVRFTGSNSPVGVSAGPTGTDSPMSQFVSCTPSGGGCALSTSLGFNGTGVNVALPFTIVSDGRMVLSGIGAGGMASDRSLYAATQTDPLHPADTLLSVVVKQPNGMTPANLTGIYRIITLEDNLLTNGQVTTRLLTGTAQFDGVNSSGFTTVASQIDRIEQCPSGTCSVDTIITGASSPVSETRIYAVTATGLLSFSGGNIPVGGSVLGGVSPDASFFVVQTQVNNVAGTSTRAITLGTKTP